jgi:hypothetical protein
MPIAPYELTLKPDNKVDIEFFENVMEVPLTDEGETMKYEYDYYRLDGIKGRPNLMESLQSNYESWIQKAREKELETPPETERQKIERLELDKQELEGVVDELIQILADKGVVW